MTKPPNELQRLLTDARITHVAFGEFIGMSRTTVTHYCNDERFDSNLLRLAAQLLADIERILTTAELVATTPPSDDGRVMFYDLTTLSIRYTTLWLCAYRSQGYQGPHIRAWSNACEAAAKRLFWPDSLKA